MADLPFAFHDLPASAFPFTLQLIDAKTRRVRWRQKITGPAVIRVPSRHEVNDGKLLAARVVLADGSTVERETPDA